MSERNPYCLDNRLCGYKKSAEDPLLRLDWLHRHCRFCDQGMAPKATMCRECELETTQCGVPD